MFAGSDKFMDGAEAPNWVLVVIESDRIAVGFALFADGKQVFFWKELGHLYSRKDYTLTTDHLC